MTLFALIGRKYHLESNFVISSITILIRKSFTSHVVAVVAAWREDPDVAAATAAAVAVGSNYCCSEQSRFHAALVIAGGAGFVVSLHLAMPG